MINRRQSLGLLAGMALGPSAGTVAAQPGAAADPAAWTQTPEGLLRALMKLRAALDDRMTLEWFQGIVYGVVDSAMQPLFTVNAVAFAHYERDEDDVFRGRRAEVTYHTAIGGGQVLEQFENPYTGEPVEVPMSRTPNQNAVIGPEGLVAPERVGTIRIESESSLGPGKVNGERSWVRLDTRTQLYADGAPSPLTTYGESITYAGSTRDILDPDLRCAPCQISYMNVMNWRPWMQMEDRPGHTTTVASGEKVESLAAVPSDLRAFVERYHTDLAQDPRAALRSDTASA